MKKPGAKERILTTAAELFSQRGYGNVGINEIIEKSGTAKASFYQHFPSKEKLCATWLGLTHSNSEQRHDKLLEEPLKPLDRVRDYFHNLKPWMLENNYRGCPYTNTAATLCGESTLIQEKVEEHKLFLRDFFVELARAFTSGTKASHLGNALFVIYSGATTESQNLHAVWPIEAATEAAVALCEAHIKEG